MMDNRKIIGLLACDPRGVMGSKGSLPWFYPEELAHFRKTTYHQIMIMGHKTYEAIPATILKDRFNIVFSRKYKKPFWLNKTVVFVSSWEDFIALTNIPKDKEVYMIGGAEIAVLFLRMGVMSEFLLTKIHKCYEGDTLFPLEFLEGWEEKVVKRAKDFTIYQYIKIRQINEN